MRNTIKLFTTLATIAMLSACGKTPNKMEHKTDKQAENNQINQSTHKTWISLTVAESKRLIARGLMLYPPMTTALESGKIIVTKGSTNTYVAEELTGAEINAGDYILGHILPSGGKPLKRGTARQEIVLYKGKRVDTPYTEALKAMSEGDIVIKGANIINYGKGQAGVLIGHPTGGTTGNITPLIQEKNLRLIIPVGLEKSSHQDIDRLSRLTKQKKEYAAGKMPYIWSIKGELFTEIEAIKQMADVEVEHLASGGIGGAEGAVSLAIFGTKEEVKKALEAIKKVQGEPPFVQGE